MKRQTKQAWDSHKQTRLSHLFTILPSQSEFFFFFLRSELRREVVSPGTGREPDAGSGSGSGSGNGVRRRERSFVAEQHGIELEREEEREIGARRRRRDRGREGLVLSRQRRRGRHRRRRLKEEAPTHQGTVSRPRRDLQRAQHSQPGNLSHPTRVFSSFRRSQWQFREYAGGLKGSFGFFRRFAEAKAGVGKATEPAAKTSGGVVSKQEGKVRYSIVFSRVGLSFRRFVEKPK